MPVKTMSSSILFWRMRFLCSSFALPIGGTSTEDYDRGSSWCSSPLYLLDEQKSFHVMSHRPESLLAEIDFAMLDADKPSAPPPTVQETCAIWERIAPWWDQQLGEGNDFQKTLIMPATDRLLDPRPGQVILDVACGNGNYSRSCPSAAGGSGGGVRFRGELSQSAPAIARCPGRWPNRISKNRRDKHGRIAHPRRRALRLGRLQHGDDGHDRHRSAARFPGRIAQAGRAVRVFASASLFQHQ